MTSVIIVDDDQDTVEVFSEFLKLKGIDVIGTGNNGLDAVKLYKKLKPDVAILDMKMPEYDGKFAIDKLKNEEPNAKIIVVTGYTEYKPEDLNVNAVFYKPYNIDSIIDAIKKISIKS